MARKTYTGEKIDVAFDLDTCIHAGECVRGLPAVFEVGRKPWILPDAADADALRDVVSRCPSGALAIVEKEAAQPSETVRIQVTEGGPLIVSGGVSVVGPDGTVIKEGAKMALCRCGRSGNSPFCDGSHAS